MFQSLPQNERIVATQIADAQRLAFLPHYFGHEMLHVESAVYAQMRALCREYSGGYWTFWALSNGGCFLSPSEGCYALRCPNGYGGAFPAEAAGVVVTLYALSLLSFRRSGQEVYATRFHQLRAFALEHALAGEIFAAID